MKDRSLKFNSILNAVRMTLTVLAPLIMFPYTSRIFLTEGNGQINFVTSTVQIFSLFASLGIYGYGIREGSKIRNNKVKFSKLTTELFLINLISTLVTYIVFLCLVFSYSKFENYRLLLLIHGVSIGFSAMGLDWIFGTYEEYIYITLRQIGLQVFTIISMFLFLHTKDDIVTWMIILTIPYIFPNIYNYFHARRYFKFVKVGFSDLRKHLKPIMILFATTIAARVYSSIDIFLLGIMSRDHNIGLYSAAIKVNTILITFLTAMTPVFMPRIVQALTENNREAYYDLLKKILSAILSIAIPAVIGLMMVGKEIILVIAGSAFGDAVITLQILAPIVIITTCSNILYYDVLVPIGKESTVFKSTVIGAIVNICISIILIPSMNENGAAIGSLVAELVAFVIATVACYKNENGFFISIKDIKNYFHGGFAIVMTCLCVRFLFHDPVMILVASIVVSTLVYFMVLLISKDFIGIEAVKLVKSIIIKLKRRNQ